MAAEVADEAIIKAVSADNENVATDALGNGASSEAQLPAKEAPEAASISEALEEAVAIAPENNDEPLLEESFASDDAPNAIEEAVLLMAAAAPPMEERAAETALVGVALGPPRSSG